MARGIFSFVFLRNSYVNLKWLGATLPKHFGPKILYDKDKGMG
jgi:hypothetical protein